MDLGAWEVVGRYLLDRPREVLYRLARSADVWERRTAIYATTAFIRRGEVDDSFRIAEMLIDDPARPHPQGHGWHAALGRGS